MKRRMFPWGLVLPIIGLGFSAAAITGCRNHTATSIPTVTGVSITAVAEAGQGETQLAAEVSGTNNPPQGVNWYIVGERSPGTRINSQGILYVAGGEGPSWVRVGARSVADPRHSDHISILLLPRLDAPVISRTGTMIHWNAVDGAGGYSLRIDGNETEAGSFGRNVRSFDLAWLPLGVGDHIVTLVATGVPGQSFDSRPSNPLTHTVHPPPPPGPGQPDPVPGQPGLPQLEPPVVVLDGTVLRWNAVAYAGGYSLRVGGVEAVGGDLGPEASYFNLYWLTLAAGDHEITLVALGRPGANLNSPPSNAVTYTVAAPPPPEPGQPDPAPGQPGLPQLPAPEIELAGTVVWWPQVAGTDGYSFRVNGIEAARLTPFDTSFDLLDLPAPLPVGVHVITMIAIGIPGESLNSPASNSITYYVIIATGVTVTVTLPNLRDMAAGIPIAGPTFGMLDPEPGQIVFDGEGHNVTGVEWFLGGNPVPAGTAETDGNVHTLTLDSRIHRNNPGPHHVTLEVTIGGNRYSRTIAFTVEL